MSVFGPPSARLYAWHYAALSAKATATGKAHLSMFHSFSWIYTPVHRIDLQMKHTAYKIMVPSIDSHALVPRICEYFALCGEGEFRLQMELRLPISWPSSRGDDAGLARWPKVITEVLTSGRLRPKRDQSGLVGRTGCAAAGFKIGKVATSQRAQAASRT